jgi:hypothetical protein
MTTEDYELMCEQMEDMADQVRYVHLETGRAIREILSAMRDEGYIDCTDDALERCARMAEESYP